MSHVFSGITDPLDPLETCPYERAHRVARSRMQTHLSKCRKNFPCTDMSICPFNSTHRLNKIEMNYHISICPSSGAHIGTTSGFYHVEKDKPKHLTLSLDQINSSYLPQSENWDDEPEVPNYNPEDHYLKKKIHIVPACLTQAQKKSFKEAERRRFNNVDEQNGNSTNNPMINESVYEDQNQTAYYQNLVSELSMTANILVPQRIQPVKKETPEFEVPNVAKCVDTAICKAPSSVGSFSTAISNAPSKSQSVHSVISKEASSMSPAAYASARIPKNGFMAGVDSNAEEDDDDGEWESVSHRGSKQPAHSHASTIAPTVIETSNAFGNDYTPQQSLATTENSGTTATTLSAMTSIKSQLDQLSLKEQKILEEKKKLQQQYNMFLKEQPAPVEKTTKLSKEGKMLALRQRLALVHGEKLVEGSIGRGSLLKNFEQPLKKPGLNGNSVS